MNKIVMLYNDGDGCTYSCDVVLPIVAESPEAAYLEFEGMVSKAQASTNHRDKFFTFHGHEMDTSTFYVDGKFYPPMFLTIDEWFNRDGA